MTNDKITFKFLHDGSKKESHYAFLMRICTGLVLADESSIRIHPVTIIINNVYLQSIFESFVMIKMDMWYVQPFVKVKY